MYKFINEWIDKVNIVMKCIEIVILNAESMVTMCIACVCAVAPRAGAGGGRGRARGGRRYGSALRPSIPAADARITLCPT